MRSLINLPNQYLNMFTILVCVDSAIIFKAKSRLNCYLMLQPIKWHFMDLFSITILDSRNCGQNLLPFDCNRILILQKSLPTMAGTSLQYGQTIAIHFFGSLKWRPVCTHDECLWWFPCWKLSFGWIVSSHSAAPDIDIDTWHDKCMSLLLWNFILCFDINSTI